jgi:lipoate-protein ligase A
VRATYAAVAEALLRALGALGIPAGLGPATGGSAAATPTASCFGTVERHEIVVAGRKLVGAAQVRRRGAFLVHGSVPLRLHAARWAAALGTPRHDASTDLVRARGGEVALAEFDRALVGALGETVGASFTARAPSPTEREQATRLRAFKYLSAAWTLEGRDPCARGR